MSAERCGCEGGRVQGWRVGSLEAWVPCPDCLRRRDHRTTGWAADGLRLAFAALWWEIQSAILDGLERLNNRRTRW